MRVAQVWVMTQSTFQPTSSSLARAASKSRSSGSSCGHHELYGMRYALSTLVAPPMAKIVFPSSSKTSPREALVVAVDEQHRVGARLQPGDIGAFLGRKVPRKAKVTGNDEIVVAGKAVAELPVAELLHVEPTVDVARHIDRHRITTSL